MAPKKPSKKDAEEEAARTAVEQRLVEEANADDEEAVRCKIEQRLVLLAQNADREDEAAEAAAAERSALERARRAQEQAERRNAIEAVMVTEAAEADEAEEALREALRLAQEHEVHAERRPELPPRGTRACSAMCMLPLPLTDSGRVCVLAGPQGAAPPAC